MGGDIENLDMVEILGNPYVAKILLKTYRQAMTAQEIGKECNIPKDELGKRLEQLEDLEFLTVTTRGEDRVYKSKLKNVQIFMDAGNVRVYLQYADGKKRDIKIARKGLMKIKFPKKGKEE